MNRGFIQIPILIAILAGMAVFGGTGYLVYEANQKTSIQEQKQTTIPSSEVFIDEAIYTSVIPDTEINEVMQKKTIAPTIISEVPVSSLPALMQVSSTIPVKTPTPNADVNEDVVPVVAPVVILNPKVKVTANPSNVEYDGTSVISWTATDALSCTLDSSPVLLSITGFQSVKPTDTSKDWSKTNKTTYSITCTGAGGSITENVTITIQPWTPPTGYKVLPAGQCNFTTAPCVTGPGGMFCSKGGCGA